MAYFMSDLFGKIVSKQLRNVLDKDESFSHTYDSDDFLSNLANEPNKDDPYSQVHDFESFLSVFANELDESDPYYHEVVSLDRMYKSQNYLEQAQKYAQVKEWELAITYFTEAINSDPNNAAAYMMRGGCYQQKRDSQSAFSDFSKVIELNPTYAQAFAFRAVSSVESNFDNAVDDFLMYFKLTNNDAEPWAFDAFAAFLLLQDERWYTVIDKLSQSIQSNMEIGVPISLKLISRAGPEQVFRRLINLEEEKINSDNLFLMMLVFKGMLNTNVNKTINIISKSIGSIPESHILLTLRSEAYKKIADDFGLYKSRAAILSLLNKKIADDFGLFKSRVAILSLLKKRIEDAEPDHKKYFSLGEDEIEDSKGIENEIVSLNEKTSAIEEKAGEHEDVGKEDDGEPIEEQFKIGIDLLNKCDYKNAYDYFSRVALKDPENWKALLFKGQAAAYQSTLKKSRIDEFYQAVKDAGEICNKLNLTTIEMDKIKKRFAQSIYDFCNYSFEKNDELLSDVLKRKVVDHTIFDAAHTTRHYILDILETALGLIIDINDTETIKLNHEIKKLLIWTYHAECALHETKLLGSTCFSGIILQSKQEYIDQHDKLLLEIRMTEPDFKKSDRYKKLAIDRLASDILTDDLNLRQQRNEELQAEIDQENKRNV